jgi:hypothetical protein
MYLELKQSEENFVCLYKKKMQDFYCMRRIVNINYLIKNQEALDLVKNELHNQKINITLNGTDK